MKRITSEKGPKAIGAYSVATKVGNIVYTSGQLGMNPSTGKLISDTIEEQTHQALTNVKTILEENSSLMKNIIKSTVYLNDINDFKAFNQVYAEFFDKDDFPSRTAIEVAALPLSAKIEIEVIALVNE
ncbi:MAG: RidA family protein [Alkalibacterium sp.]|nr:RidA family protein [Alkalibacterium sp.]TVP93264.1 MAG: RidA family protein [Alkalibacterium sp.]